MTIEFTVDHDHTYASEVGFEPLIGWISFSLGTAPGDFRVRDIGGGAPRTINIGTRRGWLHTDGHLYRDETLAAPCRLVANDPDFRLHHLTYRADFELTTTTGVPVAVPHVYFSAPATDTILYLTKVMTDPYQPVMEVRNKVFTEDILDVGAFGQDVIFAGSAEDFWDFTGVVPSANLPSYVDDVLEYNTQAAFPATGETGKIYVAKDTGDSFRWTGSAYLRISDRITASGITDSGAAGRSVVQAATASDARDVLSVYSRAQTVGPGDELPNESGFWWITEPVAVDGRVFVGTVAADRGAWMQEWTRPVAGGPLWLHRYFLGFVDVMPASGIAVDDLRDDHATPAIAVKAGKPVVVFMTNHSSDEKFSWRISDQNVDDALPGQLTFGPTRTFKTPNTNNYVQVMSHNNDIWVCHRSAYPNVIDGQPAGGSDWHLTKIPDWGTGSPVTYKVLAAPDQIYVKARIVNGVIRMMSSKHPTTTGNKIWYFEANISTGAITKADGTVLGNLSGTNLPLSQSSLDVVFTPSGTDKPWGWDVGYGSTRQLVFVDGPGNSTALGKYKYARFANNAWTVSEICGIGNFHNGGYFPSITFVPDNDNQVLLARSNSVTPIGENYIEKWQTNNSGAAWFNAETVDSATVDHTDRFTDRGVRVALSRPYPVRVESGAAPFSVIGTDFRAYPTYNYGWYSNVRPLPVSTPVKRVPEDDAIRKGLDRDYRRRPPPTTGLYLPASVNNWIEGPTNVAPPAAGIRLEVDLAAANWQPGTPRTLFGKEGNASNLGPRLFLNGDGKIGFFWSVNGSTQSSFVSDDPLPNTTAWQRIQIAADFVPAIPLDNPARYTLRIWYRYNYEQSWLPLFAEALPGATSLFNGSSAWQVNGRYNGGIELLEAIWYRATVMDLARNVLAEWRADAGSPRQVDQQGNTWTVNARGERFTYSKLVGPSIDVIRNDNLASVALFNAFNNGENYWKINSSSSSVSMEGVGSSTNIPMVFVPKGNGAFQILSSGTPELQGWGTSGTANFNITTQSTGQVLINGAAALFAGGALGTPSSGTLTNCTSLPVTGITASTSAALGVGSVELGHATDTTIARKSAGIITVEGAEVSTDVDNPHDLDSGEATMLRRNITSAAIAPTNGILRLTYFTARKTETIASIRASVGQAQVGATLMRVGIYEQNTSTGDLTLVASTANDTTLFNALGINTKALSASFTKTRGKRYAVGILQVGTTTSALFSGATLGNVGLYAPRQSAFVSSQTDLQNTYTNASLGDSGSQIWIALIP